MKASDLMICDYITHKDNVIQVTAIDDFSGIVSGRIISYRGDYSCFITEVNPIPLTEEILGKNGFEYAYNEASEMQNKQLLVANISGHYIEVRLDKKNIAIWYDYDENESGFYSDVFLELPRTVHQLQHLLRLCGIEKEIEL